MSVGHIARIFENAGIPTVTIACSVFASGIVPMMPPRLVLTPFPKGRPLGAPHDEETQMAVLKMALDLLGGAKNAGTVIEADLPYRPTKQ